MKITKKQLKRIIKEEKQKLLNEATMGFSGTGFGQQPKRIMDKSASFFGGASVLEEQMPPGRAIENAEEVLLGIILTMIADESPGLEQEYYRVMYDGPGVEDADAQRALDQLMDRHGLL